MEGDAFERAAELLRRSPEFTVLASLRQEPANSGTILSFSHGYNRYVRIHTDDHYQVKIIMHSIKENQCFYAVAYSDTKLYQPILYE